MKPVRANTDAIPQPLFCNLVVANSKPKYPTKVSKMPGPGILKATVAAAVTAENSNVMDNNI